MVPAHSTGVVEGGGALVLTHYLIMWLETDVFIQKVQLSRFQPDGFFLDRNVYWPKCFFFSPKFGVFSDSATDVDSIGR